MHFLGAVIAEKQDDIYGILAEWSEYADVDEYVKETRSEIIANGIDGEEGYWATRNATGEYEYFCDAGWGNEANAISHLEDAIAE